MNTQEIESKSRAEIERLLGSISWLNDVQISDVKRPMDSGYDMEARFSTGDGKEGILLIEFEAFPRPSQFPSVHQIRRSSNGNSRRSSEIPVLAVPRISPRMAELCEEHGWGWYDLAGNCKISVPNLLYIERTGNKPIKISEPIEANLSTSESARVIRALLMEKDIGRPWTQRSLRDACYPDVSLGLVNKVVRYLKDQAYLKDIENGGGFRLHDPLGLLQEWSRHYRFDRHVRYAYFSLHRPAEVRKRLVQDFDANGRDFALSVFSAASEQAAHVRGELKLWLYLDESQRSRFEKLTDAKETDSGANVIVMVPEDAGVFAGKCRVAHDKMPITHPVQTYVDLKMAGGRGEEAADALLEQKIKPEWNKANVIY